MNKPVAPPPITDLIMLADVVHLLYKLGVTDRRLTVRTSTWQRSAEYELY